VPTSRRRLVLGSAQHVSVGTFAKACGLPRTRIERIANEQTGITADTAPHLAKAFGTTPQLWLNLQNDYDIARPSATSARLSIASQPSTSRRRRDLGSLLLDIHAKMAKGDLTDAEKPEIRKLIAAIEAQG